jgi:hypothetical protein
VLLNRGSSLWVLSAIYDFPMNCLKERSMYAMLFSKLGKTALEMREILKTNSVTMSW